MQLTPNERDILIRLCKQRVIATGMANICSVAHDHEGDIGIMGGILNTDAEEIGNFTVQNDSKYELFGSERYWCLRKNSNYELSQSVMQTNENVRSSNKWIKIWTEVNAVAASAIVITTLLKPDTKPQLELQQMKESMQYQQQGLRNIQTSLERINLSIQNVADSIPK